MYMRSKSTIASSHLDAAIRTRGDKFPLVEEYFLHLSLVAVVILGGGKLAFDEVAVPQQHVTPL
jgi:hypothetical protein